MESENANIELKPPIISEKVGAIMGLVTIAGLATLVIMYTGVGTEQIDAVFGITAGAIAGLVGK